MRKLLALSAVLAAALAIGLAPAGAITKNFVEDFEHPFVGLIVFYDDQGEFSHRCSGSLLTSTVFLTAGHCVVGVPSARVYFQQDAGVNLDPATGIDPITGYPETCALGTLGVVCATSDELHNYGFPAGFPNRKDAGLVILDQPIALTEYGSLPEAGALDHLNDHRGQSDVTFTVSGYGVSYRSPVVTVSFRERLMGPAKLVNVKTGLGGGFNLQTNGNGDNRAGTCVGDSGGPVFYPADSNVVVGITSFGLNLWCRGTGFAYRTDQQDLLDWIESTTSG